MTHLENLVAKYFLAKETAKENLQTADDLLTEIINLMPKAKNGEVVVNGVVFHSAIQSHFDTKNFKTDYPQLYTKYYIANSKPTEYLLKQKTDK